MTDRRDTSDRSTLTQVGKATEVIACTPGGRTTVPRASVIIVNYNSGHHLERCLPSLLREAGGDSEVILVDNASVDGSTEYVESMFPEVMVIRNQANRGFGHGSNVGARRAKGAHLAFLNPDTVVEAGWLGTLVEALEADPQVGLATSKILLLADPGRINTCGNEMHYTGLTLCRGLGMDHEAYSEPAEVSAVSGAAFAVRKDVYEALGGFDESFFLYMEDTDLSWRARLAGYKCLYVSQSVVHHDYGLHFGPDKTLYQERNRYLMLLKGLRWRTLLILLPALAIAEVITWSFVLLRERRHRTNKLRAYAWIVTHWGQVMRSRRQAQSMRKVPDRDLIADCTHRLAYDQTGEGIGARLAQRVFDPLFYILQRVALAVIRW